jgi:GntR family transcriptional repressor for pyruvate dehydrogenase complex
MNIRMEQRPLKSSEWVQNDLLRQMDEGVLAPGDRLASVARLAEQYGVGRSTIREALSALKAMGRLDIRHGGGTFVRAPSPAETPRHPGERNPQAWVDRAQTLKHTLEVRRVLETGCAALAARNRTEEDVAGMADILEEMRAALGDEARSEQADVRFHQAIAAATHNPVLADLMAALASRLHDGMRDMRALWFYAEKSSAESLLADHRSICEAIAEGNPEAAASRMERHIARVERVLYREAESGGLG